MKKVSKKGKKLFAIFSDYIFHCTSFYVTVRCSTVLRRYFLNRRVLRMVDKYGNSLQHLWIFHCQLSRLSRMSHLFENFMKIRKTFISWN